MDIYQIWTTYNKKWSKYEILAFSVLLILTVIVVAGCVCRKKINLIQAVAVVIMVIFLGIVFGSTVFTRTSTVRQYELIPLWSWKAIWKYKDWTLLKENLLNCILLFPAGALLPIIANYKVKWYRALLFGVQLGMSEAQTMKTAVHETAHAVLHDRDRWLRKGSKDKLTKEVEAESIAYVVCNHFGLDTSEYSFSYIASWTSGKYERTEERLWIPFARLLLNNRTD